MTEQYQLLRTWLDDKLPDHLLQVANSLAATRPAFLDENQVRPYAAALIAMQVDDEWIDLRAKVSSKATRTAEIEEQYDSIRSYLDDHMNWRQILETCGRTRSLLTDTEAIRDGRPEQGIYYWH